MSLKIKQTMDQIKLQIEKIAFMMFAFLGDKMGIESLRVRLFFIYISFITIGSPFVLAGMIFNFWKNIFYYIRNKRNQIWDL